MMPTIITAFFVRLKVDINPITESKTGTLETYLPTVEKYLSEKAKQQSMEVTLYVAECNEFHSLGEFHENIELVEEAIKIYNSIPPERMHGIRSIGMNIHEKGKEAYEDDQIDLLVGNSINMYLVSYIPYIKDIRHIGISFNRLIDETIQQYDLFTAPEQLEKERDVQKAMIEIKSRFGKNAVLKGMNLLDVGTTRERNVQIGGHKA